MKQLHRSNRNKIIGGVAGGIAEYVDADVTLVRLIWVLSFFAGIGFLIYLICWIIIPEGENDSSATFTSSDYEADEFQQKAGRRRNMGLLLIGVGLIFLIKNMIPWYFWEKTWPLLLVLLGLYVLFNNRKGD